MVSPVSGRFRKRPDLHSRALVGLGDADAQIEQGYSEIVQADVREVIVPFRVAQRVPQSTLRWQVCK